MGGENTFNGPSQPTAGWLIPAWAGKTGVGVCWGWGAGAHPRVGGENHNQGNLNSFRPGSSPRGRGKLESWGGFRPDRRLIPAWAGKTHVADVREVCSGAHPRVGGENGRRVPARIGVGGSSPRGRGKLRSVSRQAHAMRLIPAWAGKTWERCGLHIYHVAHPRVGGENYTISPIASRRAGSSPRGRGKLWVGRTAVRAGRLIPAWAGKTYDDATLPGAEEAHPRVGGENARAFAGSDWQDGSSPRGRGKPTPPVQSPRGTRLIPAWAGKTGVGTGVGVGVWAHPRVGGENDSKPAVRLYAEGSSPRGRGKLSRVVVALRLTRLIPAWAGKTARYSRRVMAP